jgi:soluble lytic murein transglycosylase-like protein
METLLRPTSSPTPISSSPEPGSISLHVDFASTGTEAEARLPSFFLQLLKYLVTGIFLLVVVSACSAGTILGYSEAEWLDALGSGRSLPFPAGARLSELTRLGPGTLLFMAMQAEDRQDQDAARALLSAAASHETGLYARLASERYLRLLKSKADGPGILAFTASEGSKNLSPWVRASTEAEALFLTGRFAQALSVWTRLRIDFPEESADHETTLRSGVLHAALGLGTPEARQIVIEEFRGLLGMAGNAGWYTAMAGVLEAIQARPAMITALDEHELLLARARVLSGTRDYGASVLAFRAYQALVFSDPELDSTDPSEAPGNGDSPTTAIPPESRSARNNSNPGRLSPEVGGLLASSLQRPALSDLARAFLFGSRSEGEAIFSLLASQAEAGMFAPQTAYLHLFWAGRFARAAERWRQAASLFAAAAELAPDSADLDAALWYEAETRSKYSSTEAVAVLARAYSRTGNPSYYSDLLEPLSRKALADRSGTLLAALIAAAAPSGVPPSGLPSSGATPRDRARLDYLGARAVATGLISPAQLQRAGLNDQAAPIQAYVEAAMNRAYLQNEDPWYRLLAAFRLGLPLVEPADGPGAPEPPPGPVLAAENQPTASQSTADQSTTDQALAAQPVADQDPAKQTTPSQALHPEPDGQGTAGIPETLGEADELARGLIRFGMAAKTRTELGPAYRDLAPSTIRAVAEALMLAGDYGASIRAMVPLFSRPRYVPTKRDRELYWPQAFLPETRDAAERFGLPEALLFGLVRSESLFQPAVVSSAGAVGLAQLMPATAAETAGRLRMATYDVTNPADNLTLGASYFKRILDNRNGRFMPAIFSYNAGPTRFLRWENQYGPLPQDLLLEVLDYAETRQYGRNVVAAAMAYAALYYEVDLHGFLARLLGE